MRALRSSGSESGDHQVESAELWVVPSARQQERRRRLRAELHWTVYLWRAARTDPIVTKTQNISSGGFYCLLDEPFATGERLQCMLKIPTQKPDDREDAIYLRFRAQVRRVETTQIDGQLGIGCSIDDYRVVRREFPAAGQPAHL